MRPLRASASSTARLALLALLACSGFWSPFAPCQETAAIVGQVFTDRGQPVTSGVAVTVETSEGMFVEKQITNSDGQFEFQNLRKKSYRLTVDVEGFQPTQKDVDLGYAGLRVIVNLFLIPALKTRQDSAALPTLTDMRATGSARKEYEKGVRALKDKDLGRGRAHFEKAIAIYPCFARAQTDFALTLVAGHDFPRAEASLKKAIECDPEFLDANTQLGHLYNLQKRFEESEAILQQGLRRSPEAWQFSYQLGIAHYGLGEYAKAEEDYGKVQALNPTPPAEFHIKFADAHLKNSAVDKAYAEMQAYLHVEPNGRFAAKVKSIMQQIESSGILRSGQPERERER